MSDKKDGKNKGLQKSDVELWRQMTKDVDKFSDKLYQDVSDSTEDEAEFSISEDSISLSQKPSHAIPKSIPSGIDKRTDERLRRGQMKIDATLDLHGLNQEQSYAKLQQFIQNAYAQDKRCVLVITGKGRAAPGVLKQKVPMWLREESLAVLILSTHTARPKHGGDGAIYVLLRRRR